MDIDIKKLLDRELTQNDIIINDITTYPEDLIKLIKSKKFSEEDLLNYFFEKPNLKYNVLGIHFTRLFDFEISDIISNGLQSDDTDNYILKIQHLPNEFDNYKAQLIEYISNPLNKRSDGKIYFDVGQTKIYYGNSIFLKNWGGETLYCYYDKIHNTDERLIELGNELRKLTIPCLVIVKVNAYKFFAEFLFNEDIIQSIKKNSLANYKNEIWIDKDYVNVIQVIPVKYLKKKIRT